MCIFCKIVNGEIPCYKIYEDENFLAFLDISQATKGHSLLIPKKHYENLLLLEDELSSKMISLAKMIALKIQKATNAAGFNIINNCGTTAGQTVMHFHIHIIPRYVNDNFKMNFSNNSPTSEELLTLSSLINNC